MRRFLQKFPRLFFWIRRIHYIVMPPNLPRLGKNCMVHPMAMFIGPMDGVEIGDDVRIDAYAQIINRSGGRIKIGKGTNLAPFSVVKNSSRNSVIEIGEYSSLQHYSIIYGAGPVSVGSYVRIAAHSCIVPVNKGTDDPDIPIARQKGSAVDIVLDDDIWVGNGVTILDGAKIGRGSVLAAGSVIKGEIAPYSIMGGVPGRVLKRRTLPASLTD